MLELLILNVECDGVRCAWAEGGKGGFGGVGNKVVCVEIGDKFVEFGLC